MTETTPGDRLHIAFFTDTYRPAINGIVTSIDLFAGELRAQGHRVTVIGPAHPKVDHEPEFHGIRSMPLPVAPDFRVGWPVCRRGVRRLPDLAADVVHLHSPGPIGILGMRYGRRQGVPIVQTYHAMLTEYARNYVPRAVPRPDRLVGWWQHFLYNRGAAVTAPTAHIAGYLGHIGIRRPVTVLPTGLDIRSHPVAATRVRERYALPDRGPLVATLSRLAPEKNVDFLLRSFAMLVELVPESRMLVVGGGPHQRRLERLAFRLRVADRIVFTGLVPREDAVALLSEAQVFAYACRNDTQGLVVMEALAASRPIVLVREPVFDSLVLDGENGFAVLEDEFLFALRLRSILEDERLAARMGARSRRIAEAHGIDRSTRRLVELYRRLIAESHEPVRHSGPRARSPRDAVGVVARAAHLPGSLRRR